MSTTAQASEGGAELAGPRAAAEGAAAIDRSTHVRRRSSRELPTDPTAGRGADAAGQGTDQGMYGHSRHTRVGPAGRPPLPPVLGGTWASGLPFLNPALKARPPGGDDVALGLSAEHALSPALSPDRAGMLLELTTVDVRPAQVRAPLPGTAPHRSCTPPPIAVF